MRSPYCGAAGSGGFGGGPTTPTGRGVAKCSKELWKLRRTHVVASGVDTSLTMSFALFAGMALEAGLEFLSVDDVGDKYLAQLGTFRDRVRGLSDTPST